MGNVIGTASYSEKDVETEEWLKDLQGNIFLDISRKVSHSQYLKHIQKEYTEASLTDVPWSILEDVNLYQHVDASFNNISYISPNLPLRIPHLTHLNFSYNSLTHIPSSIALLFHLEELLLRENRLTSLPEELCLLSKLKMLDVSFNLIQTLPKGMGKLGSLTKLNVSHNSLGSIPRSLGLNSNLSVILASNNRCVDPPQELCNSSQQLIMYLREHAPEILPSKTLNHFPRVRSNVARSQLDDDVRTQSVASYVQTLTQTSKPASRAKTPLLLPANATKCSSDDLRDKIVGLLYGAVLGDTLGVATEYLTIDEINFYYGGGRLNHCSVVQDEHRSHFQRGKTTCVSDFVLLIFDSILQWSGVVDELELARRIIEYSIKGLKDLNSETFVTSSVINRLIGQDNFSSDPHGVAFKIAQEFSNDIFDDLHALPMAIMSGLPQFYNLAEVQSNAIRVCKTTHNHERFINATSLLAKMIAMMLQGCKKENLTEEFGTVNRKLNESYNGETKDELDSVLIEATHCLMNDLDSFQSALTDILFHGRQSRIYGAVCGGILGCRFGYSRMPVQWLEGMHPTIKYWLNDRLNLLLDMMGLP